MPEKLQEDYRTIIGDNFPPVMKVVFGEGHEEKILRYEKVGWEIDGELKGLRYGDNPNQQAALYRLVNGNLILGDVKTIKPGMHLVSDAELLQSGKHPGKTNITDADNALNILRYFMDEPIVAIMKHNNPCGVAIGSSLSDAYLKANMADRVAAFGGAIALNRAADKSTAEAITKNYSEVVVAPEFEEGVMDIFAKRKDLRIMKIANMERLKDWVGEITLGFKSLIDGSIIVENSYDPNVKTLADVKALPLGYHDHKGKMHRIERPPTEQEFKDMRFGWLVESGVTSNSVIYVKDGVTVGIGTGEQDRVGVAKIARDKAYEKLRDRICFEQLGISYNLALKVVKDGKDKRNTEFLADLNNTVKLQKGGLEGAVMVSDAFFPFRDGVDVGLREGITAIIQPGGSNRDYQSIEACNEAGTTMVYTGLRIFKH